MKEVFCPATAVPFHTESATCYDQNLELSELTSGATVFSHEYAFFAWVIGLVSSMPRLS